MKVWEKKLIDLEKCGEVEATGKQAAAILENADLKIWGKWLNSSRRWLLEPYNMKDPRHSCGPLALEEIAHNANLIGR